MSAEKNEIQHPHQSLVIPDLIYVVVDVHLWETIEKVVAQGGGQLKMEGFGWGFCPVFKTNEEAEAYAAKAPGPREILAVARDMPVGGAHDGRWIHPTTEDHNG